MKRILHWLAHKTGQNAGQVVSATSGTTLFIGFRCDTCGKVEKIHAVCFAEDDLMLIPDGHKDSISSEEFNAILHTT